MIILEATEHIATGDAIFWAGAMVAFAISIRGWAGKK